MTRCPALRLDEDWVFMSDTPHQRASTTSATTGKLHVLPRTRPSVRAPVGRQPGHHPGGSRPAPTGSGYCWGDHQSLAGISKLYEAALYVGRIGREVSDRQWNALSSVGADGGRSALRPRRVAEQFVGNGRFRITEDSALLARLEVLWQKDILNAVDELPSVADFEELASSPQAG